MTSTDFLLIILVFLGSAIASGLLSLLTKVTSVITELKYIGYQLRVIKEEILRHRR